MVLFLLHLPLKIKGEFNVTIKYKWLDEEFRRFSVV